MRSGVSEENPESANKVVVRAYMAMVKYVWIK
jgi:hypothetical protein